MPGLLIYGAYGYTGRLIAERAVAAGLTPVLAGRDEARLRAVAGDLGCDWRAVGLEDADALAEAVAPFDAVIHAAGPFALTSAPMLAACLASGAHYLDITGEIPVFEACLARDAQAKAAGVMVMPGCGFDVVPTDCVARMLADRLPGAVSLRLAFRGSAGPSRGTMRTALRHAAEPVQVRRGGVIRDRVGAMQARVDFGDGPRQAWATTWGDVATAWHTTGIPDIEVFIVVPKAARLLFLLPLWVKRLFRVPVIRRMLESRIAAGPEGPDAEERRTGEARVWGRVTDASGATAEMVLRTAEAYEFTARSAVAIAARVLSGDAPPGYQTPAGAYGGDFVLGIDGSRVIRGAGGN